MRRDELGMLRADKKTVPQVSGGLFSALKTNLELLTPRGSPSSTFYTNRNPILFAASSFS